MATLSRQQRMAIKLRASEKRILQQTIKAVEEELQKLPQVIDKDTGEIIQAGRSFDVLKSSTLKSKTAAVPSLTNTFVQQVGKQMGTFIDIKDGSDGKKKANRKTEDEEEDDDDEEKPSMSIAERRRRRRSS